MNIRKLTQALLPLTLCIGIRAAEQSSIELISKPVQALPRSFGDSGELQLSADGKWAVFTSTGNGIVTNDSNGFVLDVFLRNNESGETVLISGDNRASGDQSNGDSYMTRMSPDANFIVFQSDADNLVSGDENEDSDAFLYTRAPNSLTGGLTLLSVDSEGNQLDGASGAPVVSPDGKIFLIETTADASDLDSNESVDLYRISPSGFDLVSTRSNSLDAASVAFPSSFLGSFEASMTSDGRYITFISSGTNHAPGVPSNAAPQVYLRDMTAGTNAWLSRAPNGTAATQVASPAISTNAEFVLFLSTPLPAIQGNTALRLYQYTLASGTLSEITPFASVDQFELSDNGRYVALSSSNQVYLHDLVAGTNALVSHTAEGAFGGGVSGEPLVSADGRFVVFTSSATNLVEGATNELSQTYRFDRDTGEVALLSRAPTGTAGANGDTVFPALSADGSTAGFMTIASNFGLNDDPRGNDVFIVSTSGTGTVALASAPNALSISSTPLNQSVLDPNSISLDGRFVIFSSDAPDVVPNDTNAVRDIFVRNLDSGTTEWVSKLWWGAAHPENSTFVGASLDGMVIAYISSEQVGDKLQRGVYIRDRSTHSNYLASILPDSTAATNVAVAILSPNGRHLVFKQLAGIVPVYVRDLVARTTRQLANPPGASGALEPLVISPSGKYLHIRNTASRLYVHNLITQTHVTNINGFTEIAQPFTADDSAILITVFGTSERPLMHFALNGGTNEIIATNATALAMSLYGSKVAYQQTVDGVRGLYFYDRATKSTTSFTIDGTNTPVRVSGNSSFSLDGRYFTFLSASNFTAASSHAFNKLYRYDTLLKTIRLVSQNAAGESAELPVGSPSTSANGRLITFESTAANLIPGDLNLSSDVFLARLVPTDSNSNGVEDGWEVTHFGGLIDNANADSDSDGVSNRDEYLGGSDPKSASSLFGMTMDVDHDARSLILTVPASPGMAYQLESCSGLFSDLGWSPLGRPQVAFSTTISFEVPLADSFNAFYRISALR